MPALANLMKRWGFVKLSRYGLVLTPEGRIMSLRPAVLDDGMGGRIVGWEDTDLAAAELTKWQPAPAPARAMAARVAAPPPVPKAAVRMHTATMPTAIPTLTPASRVVPAAAPAPAPAPVSVAAPEPPEDDDWEWTIAIARARAAAEEAEAAAQVAATPAQPRRTRANTVPPPPGTQPRAQPLPGEPPGSKTMPIAAVAEPPAQPAPAQAAMQAARRAAEAAAKRVTEAPASRTRTAQMPAMTPMESGSWPRTEPVGTIDYETPTVVTAPKGTPTAHAAVRPRASSPVTVIPVPKLPSIKTSPVMKIEPAVAPRRIAKGTGPVDPSTTTVVPPPADDRTKPGIALPPAAKAVALPSVKRLAR